ncbi:MAG: AI-2E family transporter [Vicinamibacterales bacterium]
MTQTNLPPGQRAPAKQPAAARQSITSPDADTSREEYEAAEKRALIRYALAMTALAVIVTWAAYLVRGVLLLLYISGLLAIGFSPIVRVIERQKVLPIGTRRFPRWLAILILYLAILGTLAAIGALVFPPLIDQAQQLWSAVPGMFERAQDFLISKKILTEHLTFREAVERAPVGQGGQAVGTVVSALAGVVGGIVGLLTILILTFYFLVEAGSLRRTLLLLFPPRRRKRVDAVSAAITTKVSAWLGGQLLLAAIIGTTSAVFLWAFGIPFFYVLALISAIGELIPVVGPILSAVPAIAVAATVSLNKVILVIIFFVLQQQLENHVLVPKVMERQVGVNPVAVIVALLIGGNLLGIAGAILAVPTVAILQVLFTEWLATRSAE